MLGGIIGDIIGSTYEFNPVKEKDFEIFRSGSHFTDDTALTVATADAILNDIPYSSAYRKHYRRDPGRGYGTMFHKWARSDEIPAYNSFGNGSAMRVSPVGWAFSTLEEVLDEAKKSAEVSHNHPEGIKGAQATAAAIFLARTGKTKEDIRSYIEREFEYNLSRPLDEVREIAVFSERCMDSVPEAIMCFLESNSYEDAIRNAISLGADADTQACIAGSVAEAFYGGVPEDIRLQGSRYIPPDYIRMIEEFSNTYIKHS